MAQLLASREPATAIGKFHAGLEPGHLRRLYDSVAIGVLDRREVAEVAAGAVDGAVARDERDALGAREALRLAVDLTVIRGGPVEEPLLVALGRDVVPLPLLVAPDLGAGQGVQGHDRVGQARVPEERPEPRESEVEREEHDALHPAGGPEEGQQRQQHLVGDPAERRHDRQAAAGPHLPHGRGLPAAETPEVRLPEQ
eukprot:CAMPEP_0179263542 /NCGR_PEP_ID=MMETSP0797-20121207/27932_1 /TAXON_ID=47934 /ORGANISM="Dinophysis acuminata, Strain DAEP01" /LENGTH=197 /DNA_ID=CAMNT_0020971703 /DNA_START=48 /DNA_END=639 /DNA_ORIENTATION=+